MKLASDGHYRYSSTMDTVSIATKLPTIKSPIIATVEVDFVDLTWRHTIVSAVFYALEPIVLPVMILASKLLKRRIRWFPSKCE